LKRRRITSYGRWNHMMKIETIAAYLCPEESFGQDKGSLRKKKMETPWIQESCISWSYLSRG